MFVVELKKGVYCMMKFKEEHLCSIGGDEMQL